MGHVLGECVLQECLLGACPGGVCPRGCGLGGYVLGVCVLGECLLGACPGGLSWGCVCVLQECLLGGVSCRSVSWGRVSWGVSWACLLGRVSLGRVSWGVSWACLLGACPGGVSRGGRPRGTWRAPWPRCSVSCRSAPVGGALTWRQRRKHPGCGFRKSGRQQRRQDRRGHSRGCEWLVLKVSQRKCRATRPCHARHSSEGKKAPPVPRVHCGAPTLQRRGGVTLRGLPRGPGLRTPHSQCGADSIPGRGTVSHATARLGTAK